jgi:hypothetical protein
VSFPPRILSPVGNQQDKQQHRTSGKWPDAENDTNSVLASSFLHNRSH